MPVMTRAPAAWPTYLPIRNCRRDHRLAHQVMAVRPSISSLIDMAAASTAEEHRQQHDGVEAHLP